MSQHTLCDKCNKPLEGEDSHIQVVVTELSVDAAGGTTIVTPAVTYDYHVNHAPKFVKAKPEEPTPE